MTGSMSVYFNLHKRVFSIKNRGLVAGHALHIQIDDPWFVVSESGRQRVLKEQRKNVHAYVRGARQDVHPLPVRKVYQRKGELEVKYSPYWQGHFYLPDVRETLKVVGGEQARLFVDESGIPRIYVLHPVLEEA